MQRKIFIEDVPAACHRMCCMHTSVPATHIVYASDISGKLKDKSSKRYVCIEHLR
jgi:hypothetical protein